jgi:hypothetical protein
MNQAITSEALLVRAYYPSRMIRRRQWLTVLCLLLAPGTLASSVVYALHLCGPGYRKTLEQRLSDRLGMVVEVDAVRPFGFYGRQLMDTRVFMEPGGPEVFRGSATYRKPATRRAGEEYILTLSRGFVFVGTTQWRGPEFERMLRGGLGHSFLAMGLREVRLSEMDIRFAHGATEFEASDATGVLIFDDDGIGRASVSCTRFNGVEVDEAVNISVRFTPTERAPPRFHHVRLTVPTMPLSALGLERLIDKPVTRGTFRGTINYHRMDEYGEEVTLTGSVADADLEALTASTAFGPLRGTVRIDLEEALFQHQTLKRIKGSGQVYDLDLSGVAPGLIEDPSGATLELRIVDMDWREGRWNRLTGSGHGANLSLEPIARLIGQGPVTGTASMDIRSFAVIDDKLAFTDAVITAVPPSDQPGVIGRELLAVLGEQWIGLDLRDMLPERVEYREFGARLTIEDGQLRVRGTHGTDGRTILTVVLFGQPWGIVREPRRTFDVPDIVALLRERAEQITADDIQSWWDALRNPKTEDSSANE